MELVNTAARQRFVNRLAGRAAHRGLAGVHSQRRRLVGVVTIIDEVDSTVNVRVQLTFPKLMSHDGMRASAPRNRRPVDHVSDGDLRRAGLVLCYQIEQSLAAVNQADFVRAGNNNRANGAVFFEVNGKPVELAFAVDRNRSRVDGQDELLRYRLGQRRVGFRYRDFDLEPVTNQRLQPLGGVPIGSRRRSRQHDRRCLIRSQRNLLSRRSIRAGNRVYRAGFAALRHRVNRNNPRQENCDNPSE